MSCLIAFLEKVVICSWSNVKFPKTKDRVHSRNTVFKGNCTDAVAHHWLKTHDSKYYSTKISQNGKE